MAAAEGSAGLRGAERAGPAGGENNFRLLVHIGTAWSLEGWHHEWLQLQVTEKGDEIISIDPKLLEFLFNY